MEEKGTETEVPEKEEQALTPEQVKELQTQLQTATDKIESQEKSYKGLQQTVNQKDQELKRQGDLRGDFESLRDTQKVLAAIVAESASTDPNEVTPEKRGELLKRYEAESQRIETESRKRVADAQQADRTSQATAIFDRAGQVIKDPLELKKVEAGLVAYAMDNKVLEKEMAELVVAKFENTEPEQKDEKKEEELFEEKYKKYLKDNNLLQGEGTKTVGSNETDDAIRDAYIKDPDNRENKRKNDERRARLGL